MVGAECAQRGRTQDVGTVADDGAREVEAWLQQLQRLADFHRAGIGQFFLADDVNRCGGFLGGPSARARTGDLYGVELGGGLAGFRWFGLWLLRCLRLSGGGQGQ